VLDGAGKAQHPVLLGRADVPVTFAEGRDAGAGVGAGEEADKQAQEDDERRERAGRRPALDGRKKGRKKGPKNGRPMNRVRRQIATLRDPSSRYQSSCSARKKGRWVSA
jgi:hypothetical protein